jgi:hypothetical protein
LRTEKDVDGFMRSDDLTQQYCFGGYYIIRPTARAGCMNENVLHDIIVSASRCICDVFPDPNVIWSDSKERKVEYMNQLGLDSQTYSEMEQWISREFEQSFDFPDVFNNYEKAAEFLNKYLYNLKDLTIVGLALPEILRSVFIEDQTNLKYGICKNIDKSKSVSLSNSSLGFEILGFESGGFHSYICNGLENDYYNKYNLKLNENGFIGTLEEAQKLADYTNHMIEGTEPVLWLPWAVLKISDCEYSHEQEEL